MVKRDKLKHFDNQPLPFRYESTGVLTRFTDTRDPKPRSRLIFSFHRPETLQSFLKEGKTLRARLHDFPNLDKAGLRECQIKAITNLLDDVIELQKLSPGTEPLKMACEFVGVIHSMDVAKIQEIRACIKEAGKLPLADILTEPKG